MAGRSPRSWRRSRRRSSASGPLRSRPSRARRRRSPSPNQHPARSRSRSSFQAATRRSRRPTATPPCRPTSRPCRAGKATSAAASTRSSCAPSPRSQGGQMELAVLWHRGPGLVPRHPLLHEVHQGGVLPRRVAASCPARRVQAKGSALPRHPRGRPARRSSIRRLGEASQPIARRTNVSGRCEVRARRPATSANKSAVTDQRAKRLRCGCQIIFPLPYYDRSISRSAWRAGATELCFFFFFFLKKKRGGGVM